MTPHTVAAKRKRTDDYVSESASSEEKQCGQQHVIQNSYQPTAKRPRIADHPDFHHGDALTRTTLTGPRLEQNATGSYKRQSVENWLYQLDNSLAPIPSTMASGKWSDSKVAGNISAILECDEAEPPMNFSMAKYGNDSSCHNMLTPSISSPLTASTSSASSMPPPPPVPPPPLSVPKAAPHAPGGVSGSSDASLLQLDEDEGGSWANGPTSHTSRTTSATSTSQRAVERCDYRLKELRQNNITLLRTRDQLPSHVQSLINTISQARSSPGPTDTDIIKDDWLEALELGADESMVGSYWTTYFVTPPRPFDSIASSANHLIHKRFVPHIDGICKLSTPKPDLLYGYQDTGAFPSPAYQRLLSDTSFHTDCQNILFPFLAVEFKGTLSGGKDMWVATNQCLGAGAALVNAAEILVEQAQGQSKVQSNGQSASCSFETSAFTIAFDGVEARIFITWLDRDTQIFCTKRVETFHILHPHSYRRLRSLVRNIMAWGAGTRLDGILKLFDAISAATAAGTTDIPGPSGETSVGIHGPRKRTRPVFRGSNAGRSRGRSSSSRRTGPHTSQQDHTSEIID